MANANKIAQSVSTRSRAFLSKSFVPRHSIRIYCANDFGRNVVLTARLNWWTMKKRKRETQTRNRNRFRFWEIVRMPYHYYYLFHWKYKFHFILVVAVWVSIYFIVMNRAFCAAAWWRSDSTNTIWTMLILRVRTSKQRRKTNSQRTNWSAGPAKVWRYWSWIMNEENVHKCANMHGVGDVKFLPHEC